MLLLARRDYYGHDKSLSPRLRSAVSNSRDAISIPFSCSVGTDFVDLSIQICHPKSFLRSWEVSTCARTYVSWTEEGNQSLVKDPCIARVKTYNRLQMKYLMPGTGLLHCGFHCTIAGEKPSNWVLYAYVCISTSLFHVRLQVIQNSSLIKSRHRYKLFAVRILACFGVCTRFSLAVLSELSITLGITEVNEYSIWVLP